MVIRGLSLVALTVPIHRIAAQAQAPSARDRPSVCAPPSRGASLAARLERDPVATFDTAWALIARSHWDTTFNGVDWTGVRAALRPQATAARTTGELRRVMGDMVGRLHQSHFAIIPQEVAAGTPAADVSAPSGDAGLEIRLLNDSVVVTAVAPGSPAAVQGVRPGWVITRIAGCPVDTRQAGSEVGGAAGSPRARALAVYQAVHQAMAGAVGDTLDLGLLDERNRAVSRRLVRGPLPGTVTKFGNLPPLAATLSMQRLPQEGRTVGIIRFNIWMPLVMREFDAAIDSLRDVDGIILDLRGNFGGVGGMTMGVAGHFLDSAVSIGTMTQRHNTLRFVVNPRRVDTKARSVRPYAGPLAIVVDELSVSTTEIFAKGLQALRRARVFGTQTAGQALPAVPERLPNGDILYHAVADFRSPRGDAIEGDGVIPDVAMPTTRAALLARRDPPLDAAIGWLLSMRSTSMPRQ